MTKFWTFLIFIIIVMGYSQKESFSLFNGKDLDGWHIDVPIMDSIPHSINPFIIRNGMLVSLGTPRGHLITDSVFQDYRFVIE